MRGTREQIELPSGHSFRVLRWTRTVREVETLYYQGSNARLKGEGDHWHYHAAMELTLFTSGDGTRFVGDHIAPFCGGDLVLLGEKLPHYWHTRGASSGISVQWDFPNGHPFWTFPESHAAGSLFQSASRGLRFTGSTAEILRAGLHSLSSSHGLDRLGLLFRVFALMTAAPETNRVALSTQTFALSIRSAHQQAISEAVRHLLTNFREEIRLEEVLKLTGMSKPTFSRQFKKHSGKTFSDFLSQIRLQAACRDLVETERSVLEIALSSGYTQVSFFNRIFRRIFDCSPTQYRERKRSAPSE
ncbi:MAG: AraC-type DNA-binding protein [Chthoniobacteraceae bacterium]|nr:AraC-type DNA-binding protein [Chthoniobacteraceae bacterium]